MNLPNQITSLRIILTPVFLFLFLSENSFLKQISLIVFFIAAATDWLDGWLARKTNSTSEFGATYDPLADKVLTLSAFIAFVFINVLSWWMVAIVVARDIIITYIRYKADVKNLTFTTSFSAKVKTFAQMTFIYYLLIVYTFSTIEYFYKGSKELFALLIDSDLIYYTMLSVTIITVYTAVEYFFKNKSLLKEL